MMTSDLPTSPKKTRQMRKLFSLVALSLLLAGSAMAASSSAPTPEIWFFLRPYAVMANGVDGRQGWQKLFLEPNAPWPPFMDDVQVVALAGNMKTVPDDVLATAFAKLKQRRIGFAIESLAQSWVGYEQFKCGHGVEGYTDPPGNAQIARRIKAAGGELVYVTWMNRCTMGIITMVRMPATARLRMSPNGRRQSCANIRRSFQT
jgi:hypothetical protein